MAQRQPATFLEAWAVPPWWAVRLEVEHPPAPGQFVLAALGGPLREPLFPAACDAESFTVMAPPGHALTRLLPGAAVDLLGPLGRGFRLAQSARLLLIAEAARVPLLLPLIDAAPAVALVIEAPTRAQLPPPQRFPPRVELHLLTHDGSAGHAGTLEHQAEAAWLTALLTWAEHSAFACAAARYPALSRWVRQTRLRPAHDFAQALVQVALPCGVGACDVCRIQTQRGERRACVDGPVFDLLTLEV